MANKKYKTRKLNYSIEERRAFKRGMAAQYNKEHPKVNYETFTVHTHYNADGSIFDRDMTSGGAYKTKAAADADARRANKLNKIRNERVWEAVKAKKVNVYGRYTSHTEVVGVKKVNRRAKAGEKVH